ncbi:MAG: HNH endonuclease [Fimbriimonadaceae bacterium]|nr:HNH endonuclease [Fimbriimonadaceae bacterium]
MDSASADNVGNEPPRLIPFAHLVVQMRNRAYMPQLGRFLQPDPNATALTLIEATSFHGRGMGALVAAFDVQGLYGDGMNLYEYLGSSPWNSSDPLGLYEWDDFWEDAFSANFGLPGPSDFITGALQSLVEEYSANLDWDVEWALNWDLPDDAHSRLDNRWVVTAMGRGLYDAFDFGIGDHRFNPLDRFAVGSGSKSRFHQRRIGVGGGSANFSARIHIKVKSGSYHVNVFRSPKYKHKFVVFPESAIKEKVRITPQGNSDADIAAANARFGKSRRYNWVNEYGVPCTWHHDNVRGRLYLVPSDLHNRVKPHIGGGKTWYE